MRRFLLSPSLLLFIVVVVVSLHGQGSLRDELDQAVQAYKAARYDEATQHFRNAIALDPQNVQAHLYLATAYAQQYIPGVDNAENNHLADDAISEYQTVLQIDPRSMDSMKGIASLHLQSKRFGEARSSYRKALVLDPNDPEIYYSIGVIDWTQAYTKRMPVFETLHLSQDQPLINKPECWQVRSANETFVKDGMEMLTKAMQLRPDYDDAMAYMNLMYREQANIQCSDPTSYQSDIQAADHWVDLVMATKKAKAAKADHSPQKAQ